MINKTYISKSTTIVKDSEYNFGLNPISELNYGNIVSRALIYFDISELKNRANDKTYCNISNLKHVLKLTNCGTVDPRHIDDKLIASDLNGIKERAASFDIILFKIPKKWDAGRGFDYGSTIWLNGKATYTKHGCNWFQASDGYYWDEDGIYSNLTLAQEYNKFSNSESNIVIGRQHFDYGNENFEIDITDTVNKFILGEEENYGIGIAFSPLLEESNPEITQYIGFFNNNTNTFFEPYLESTYNEYISDDRASFYLNKYNKLYLYANINGELNNLDELPICNIDGKQYEVKQATKGVYYAEILLKSDEVDNNTIMYDTWSNLVYNGTKLDDVEMEFVALAPSKYLNIGNSPIKTENLYPILYGINDNENIIQGDIRIVNVEYKLPYSNNKNRIIDGGEYRIYTKDGNREIEVIPFHPIEKMHLYNFFAINSSDFVPNTYYVDVRIKHNSQIIRYNNKLRFNIISQINNMKK